MYVPFIVLVIENDSSTTETERMIDDYYWISIIREANNKIYMSNGVLFTRLFKCTQQIYTVKLVFPMLVIGNRFSLIANASVLWYRVPKIFNYKIRMCVSPV